MVAAKALWARVRSFIVGPLDGEMRQAFAREVTEANVRRLRAILPLMLVLHVVHIALFQTNDAMRATLAPIIVQWRDDLVLVHAVTFGLALPLALLLPWLARSGAAPLLGPGAAVLYLVHGAVIAGVDQLSMANVSAFIGYALAIAVVVCLTPTAALAVYAVGLASFEAAIAMMQPSPTARLMVLPMGISVSVVSVALSLLLYVTMRRDFGQRVTIAKQREELAEMNAALERRVSKQVSEIVQRSREIEHLNAQLQVQVQTRSAELSMALAKLARERGVDGKLRAGVVLGDRFVIERLIGEGGMGSVYAGLDRTTNERVAIKVIQASSAQQLDALHRFLREAEAVATVSHPAVVRMIHVDVSADGMLFQVQELVDGETLQSRIRRGEWREPERVARVGSLLCEALAAAHERGVIHRDVKPANMMLMKVSPGLKLLDFGISRVLRGQGADASSGGGEIMGTPAYMAPETIDRSEKPSDKADVYAVGVVLFMMLTGKLPFGDGATREILLGRVIAPAPDVRTLAESTPPELADIVARCLAKEPARRPPARQLASELAAIADARGAAPLEILAREVASLRADQAKVEPETVVVGKRKSSA